MYPLTIKLFKNELLVIYIFDKYVVSVKINKLDLIVVKLASIVVLPNIFNSLSIKAPLFSKAIPFTFKLFLIFKLDCIVVFPTNVVLFKTCKFELIDVELLIFKLELINILLLNKL